MRRKLALAASAVAVAAAFGPVSGASAQCDPVLYELTGWCSPCRPVNDVLKSVGAEPLTCTQ